MSSTQFNDQQERYWQDKKQLTRRDPRHPIVQTYVKNKIAFICKFFTSSSPLSIVDIGAGNGYFSYWWNQKGTVTAIDYSDVMLQNNPVKKKLVMDARHLEFADSSFDLTFCHAVLHHIDRKDRPQVLREMKRVSKKHVVIIEPNRNNPLVAMFCMLKKEERGGLDFSLSYCKQLMQEAGLNILYATSWGLLTPNRMPFSRILLPLFKIFERPMPLGMTNIVIAQC